MTKGEELYQAILERRSVRRYDRDPLDSGTTALIEEVIGRARPLVPQNRFEVLRREVSGEEDLVDSLGAYGRIVSPPSTSCPSSWEGPTPNPVAPPPDLAPLVEAARSAPSAADAQPWRFLWRDGRLHLFVKRRNRRYGGGLRESYRFHDAGACMANVSLALEARGQAGAWTMHDPARDDAPLHPAQLQPLATLALA